MSILVLGTVALDTVKTPFGFRKHILGGSAVHFAMSCRLFNEVNLVAVIGEDFPPKYLHLLRAKSIILTSLLRQSGKTFQWKGEYKKDLQTAFTLSTELGVLLNFKPTISKEQRNIPNIFLANVDPDMQMHLLGHLRSPKLVALDSMNYWIEQKRKSLLMLLKKVQMYVANEQEAKDLSGEDNLVKAAKRLRSLGPEMVVIKKGEHGLLFLSDTLLFCLPAYPTDAVIDPTGAGDTFAGGLLGYLASRRRIDEASIKKALLYGTVAASFNVEGFGVDKTSRLTGRQLQERVSRFKKFIQMKPRLTER